MNLVFHFLRVFQKFKEKIFFFEILILSFLKITDPIQISPSHFEKIRHLGNGCIGKVYLTKEKSTQKQYSIKFIKTELTDNNEIVQFVKVISQINHPAILKPYGYSLPDQAKKRPMSIVTDYLENGSLETLLQNPQALNDTMRMRILFGLAESLRFLHENSFIHGNLKPGNILLDSNFDPMLTDFSLLNLLPRNAKINSRDICFFAPEINLTQLQIIPPDQGDAQNENQKPINFAKFDENILPTEKSDIFSYGMIVYVVMTGSYPYDEANINIASEIQEGQRPELTDEIPEYWQTLISECWDINPDKRPSFESIVLRFLRNEFKFPLKGIERVQFRNYQTSCLSSTFATRALLSTIDQIESLSESNKALNRTVDSLKKSISEINASVSQLQKSIREENPPQRETVKFVQDFKPPQSSNKPNWNAVNASRRFSTKQPMARPILDAPFSNNKGAKNDDSVMKHSENILDMIANSKPTPTMRRVTQNESNAEKDAFPGFSPSNFGSRRLSKENENRATFSFPSLPKSATVPVMVLTPTPPPLEEKETEKENIKENLAKDEDLSPFPSFGINQAAQVSILVPPMSESKNPAESIKQVSISANSDNDGSPKGGNLFATKFAKSEPDLPIAIPPQRQKSLGLIPASIQQIPNQDSLKPRLSLQTPNITKSSSHISRKGHSISSSRSNFSDESLSSGSTRGSFSKDSPGSAPTSPFGHEKGGKKHRDSLLLTDNSLKKLKKGISLKELPETIQFPFNFDQFNGIFAHLTAEANGNIVDKGIIRITGNHADINREKCINQVVNFSWNKCWTSSNHKNSYIEFDFLYHHVLITHYTIKTYPCGAGYSHLKNWALDGSNDDGNTWFVIDTRDNINELNGKSKVATFEVSIHAEFSKVRIRQTGPNHYGDDYLILTNVEFFGDYY